MATPIISYFQYYHKIELTISSLITDDKNHHIDLISSAFWDKNNRAAACCSLIYDWDYPLMAKLNLNISLFNADIPGRNACTLPLAPFCLISCWRKSNTHTLTDVCHLELLWLKDVCVRVRRCIAACGTVASWVGRWLVNLLLAYQWHFHLPGFVVWGKPDKRPLRYRTLIAQSIHNTYRAGVRLCGPIVHVHVCACVCVCVCQVVVFLGGW